MDGFFVGAGGSYNAVRLKQEGFGLGIVDVHDEDLLVGFGVAGGPIPTFRETDDVLAPDLQGGFIAPFTESGDWLFGFKARYSYLGAELTNSRIDSPQVGQIVELYPEPVEEPMSGNAVIKSMQTRVDHEILFVPFLGYSFTSGFLYGGAGPALFGTKSKINDLVGLADIDGNHFVMTGTPMDFSSSEWMWGGAVQAGITYFISESWFVDVNYTYARSDTYKQKYSAPFTNENDGLTYTGTVYVESSDKITSQGVSITLNTLF
jgi:opacity protein-like surface antigen